MFYLVSDQFSLESQTPLSCKKLHVAIAKIAYFFAGSLLFTLPFDVQSQQYDLSTSSVDNPLDRSDKLSWQLLVLSERSVDVGHWPLPSSVSPTSRGRVEKSLRRESLKAISLENWVENAYI